MNKEQYLSEIERRLLKHFSASHDGYKVPANERHRLEGFIQGAVFMGFASNQELSVLMDNIHKSVFGKSIQERKSESHSKWQESNIDYTPYDQPAYERKGS
jgi:hypothetical protein